MQNNILFEATDLYKANYDAPENTVINQGGSSSGKTYAIDQCLFTHAYEDRKCVCTIAGQDLPNLKVGAIRDAEEIVDNSSVLRSMIKTYNKSEHTYYYHNGSIIEFKSYGGIQDAKSGKRDYLFMNEANGLTLGVWNELYLRTNKKAYLDFNPNAEFWVHTDLIGQPDTKLIISDHRHNPFVSDRIRQKLENINDPELFKVYARGMTGRIEGVIFRFEEIDGMPPEAKHIAYGMDFGFTNDPTTLTDVAEWNGGLVLDELIYSTDLTNNHINNMMLQLGIPKHRTIVADSSAPKDIKDLSLMGWNIEGADKGPDSVNAGINKMKEFKLYVTKRSSFLKKELKVYKWRQTKAGLPLNEPVDFMNHAIDGVRYVILNRLMGQASGQYDIIF